MWRALAVSPFLRKQCCKILAFVFTKHSSGLTGFNTTPFQLSAGNRLLFPLMRHWNGKKGKPIKPLLCWCRKTSRKSSKHHLSEHLISEYLIIWVRNNLCCCPTEERFRGSATVLNVVKRREDFEPSLEILTWNHRGGFFMATNLSDSSS